MGIEDMGANLEAVWAIGLMSGTSMDGVDAALIKTDGERVLEFGANVSTEYEPEFRDEFRKYLGKTEAPDHIVDSFTKINASAVEQVFRKSGIRREDIRVVGFHGQTLFHDAPAGVTVQVGNGSLLAELTGFDVVEDFRSADVAAGGEGAPFAPLYHRALAGDLEKPVVVLNMGGVSNVTYLGKDQILAFDTGPASALLDDWVLTQTGQAYDEDGKIARQGVVSQTDLETWLAHPYFNKIPPKSLDRDDFSKFNVDHLSLEDGAATLTAFTIQSVLKALEVMPSKPIRWLVTGGGRHNSYFLELLRKELACAVDPVEAVGWNGDELEAEAFGFLAVRHLRGLPLSIPETTGVSQPMKGGRLCPKPERLIAS